jgi:hypothetical protein
MDGCDGIMKRLKAKSSALIQADVATAGRTFLICCSLDGSTAQSSVHYSDCRQDFRRCEDRRMSVATLISSPGFTLAQ